jgi:hypothetical protein
MKVRARGKQSFVQFRQNWGKVDKGLREGVASCILSNMGKCLHKVCVNGLKTRGYYEGNRKNVKEKNI